MKKLYWYDNKELSFKPIKMYKFYIYVALVPILIFSCLSAGIATKVVYETIPVVYIAEKKQFNIENFKKELYNSKIRFPEVVWKQALLESNRFKSPVFLEANNCFGMKISASRPNMQTGEYLGFAEYRNVHECLADYAIWQSLYCKEIKTEEDYIDFLDKIYCPNQGYKELIKQIK